MKWGVVDRQTVHNTHSFRHIVRQLGLQPKHDPIPSWSFSRHKNHRSREAWHWVMLAQTDNVAVTVLLLFLLSLKFIERNLNFFLKISRSPSLPGLLQ